MRMSTYVQHMDHAIILDEVSFPIFQANVVDWARACGGGSSERPRERGTEGAGRKAEVDAVDGETRARKAGTAAADTRRKKEGRIEPFTGTSFLRNHSDEVRFFQ